jgi:hypothetical protein
MNGKIDSLSDSDDFGEESDLLTGVSKDGGIFQRLKLGF